MKVADLVLDPAAHRVSRGSHEIRLSPTEYKLLELLMRRAGRVVTRSTIVNSVWGLEQDVEENTLDAFVRLLRSKVDKDFNPKLIQTVQRVWLLRVRRTQIMKSLPIQFRLTAWYSVILATVLLLFGLTAYIAMRNSILQTVDETLQDRVKGVRELIEQNSAEGEDDVRSEFREHSELAGAPFCRFLISGVIGCIVPLS